MTEHGQNQDTEATFYEGASREVQDQGGYAGRYEDYRKAYGADAVREKLEGIRFPASKQEVLDRLGDEDVQWTKDRKINLRVIFDRMPDRIETPTDVAQAVSDHLDAIDHRPDR